MVDEIKLLGDAKLDGKIVEGHIRNEQVKLDRALIGNIFGSPNSVPRNVAAVIAIVASTVLIFSAVQWAGDPQFGYKDAIAALSGLITLTVGYLFGRSSRD